jgi:UDPglucose 6-dehydrogenase
MRVCVLGLRHLGSVTAAALAELGHRVVGLDFDATRVAALSGGVSPIAEPGLQELLERGLSSGNLRFASTLDHLIEGVDVLWVTYDTPIDDNDHPDTNLVMKQIERALPRITADTVVLVSSQLPVGSTRRLEQAAAMTDTTRHLRVAYCPENLRLGSAVRDFLHPDRIVVGVRSDRDKESLRELLSSITPRIEWMSVESAEMTKHAINAFLATSVAFVNEIASLCESVGADAKDVERGLKTEKRIGPRAYLSPGGAFSGGTLARDIGFLSRTSLERGIVTPLLSSVLPSNNAHKRWLEKKLRMFFADLSRTTVAVWGLAYKPGVDSLQRSASAEFCDWLIRVGATIRVHDPMVKNLPDHWLGAVTRCADPITAARGAHALVIATEWPGYRTISAEQLVQCSDGLVVLDANRTLPELASTRLRLKYVAVGMPGMEA